MPAALVCRFERNTVLLANVKQSRAALADVDAGGRRVTTRLHAAAQRCDATAAPSEHRRRLMNPWVACDGADDSEHLLRRRC